MLFFSVSSKRIDVDLANTIHRSRLYRMMPLHEATLHGYTYLVVTGSRPYHISFYFISLTH